MIDADTVIRPYFVIERDSNSKVICMAKEQELWERAFTNVYGKDD